MQNDLLHHLSRVSSRPESLDIYDNDPGLNGDIPSELGLLENLGELCDVLVGPSFSGLAHDGSSKRKCSLGSMATRIQAPFLRRSASWST